MAESSRMRSAERSGQVDGRRRRTGRVRSAAGCVLASAAVSVVVEWIGMTWWWPELGAEHSAGVLKREADYLNEDFRPSAARILGLAERAYYYAVEWTGLATALRWLGGAVDLAEYVRAALATFQVLIVRLALLLFSVPVFALFGLVGLACGLTLRDIRRWSAGREFGGLYHAAKRSAPRLLFAGAFVYLAIPFSVHPTAVIVPGAAAFGGVVLVVSASFKKYL